MSLLEVVVGGQFGSEAKGACTARLAADHASAGGRVTVVRVAGPNAGHTAYDESGQRWALRQVPVAAVTAPDAQLVIGAGSEIDMDVLVDEVDRLEAAGIKVRDRLGVDTQATMIGQLHKDREIRLSTTIGSTGKGIGAARSDRLMRVAELAAQHDELFEKARIDLWEDTSAFLTQELERPDSTVLIEGTQGYGLGLHAGYYPQCTSSDCRAIDFLSMAGIDPSAADAYRVVVVMRTYPIRVAGNSGPLRGETSWEQLGFEPERTTVTNKIRRVGNWDADLVRRAVDANGGRKTASISLSMADYVVPALHGFEGDYKSVATELGSEAYSELRTLVSRVERDAGATVRMIGTSPTTFVYPL